MEKILITILITLFLSGCAGGNKKISLLTIEEPRAKLNLESPEPLTLEDIKWIKF